MAVKKNHLFSQSIRVNGEEMGHGEIKDWEPFVDFSDAISIWNDEKIKRASLDCYVANAARSLLMKEAGEISVVQITDEGTAFASQYLMPSGKTCIAYATSSGVLQVSVRESTGKLTPVPTLGSAKVSFDQSGMMAALLLAQAKANDSLRSVWEECVTKYQETKTLPKMQIYKLCDMMEYGFKRGFLAVGMTAGNITQVSRDSLEAGGMSGELLCGPVPHILFGSDEDDSSLPKGKKPIAFKKLYEMKELKEYRKSLKWTEEEKKLIPSFPDDFPVGTEVQKIIRRFLATRNQKRPIVQIRWVGISAAGKSTGCELVAALTGTPLLRETCWSTMDTQDMLSKFVPKTDDDPDDAAANLPSEEDMEFDPEWAFFEMTHVWKEDATTDLCKKMADKLRECGVTASGDGPRFKLVSSNYITGLEKGYIVEIQELSRIRDQGVPVGLNEYDRGGARIPKADGTFTVRNPRALTIFTDNTGYATCHDLDPAVLRRMAFVLTTKEISKADALARIKYNTGCDNDEQLETMYIKWHTIQKFCQKNGIDSGVCTINELEEWVRLVMVDGEEEMDEDLFEAVIAKATSDEEEQNEILTAVSLR